MASLEFIGTATTLLRLGPFTLLTDPNFLHRGQRAYLGKGLFSKRLSEPSLQPGDLPDVDAVVLSHLHGDHFDRIARRELSRDLPIYTTGAASRKLQKWGFAAAVPMTPWDVQTLHRDGSRLTITSIPGQHAPGPVRHLLPPVMGSVLELEPGPHGRPFRVYVTGDTLYRPWLRQVTERQGPLDVMVAHLGGTRALGLLVTMDARQGAGLMRLLRPRVTVPVHFDDYTVFRSPLSDFLRICAEENPDLEVTSVPRGQRADLTEET
jgi:L-ascorbate metabolism protein UlaG (beta-lactamase superfamily)